MASADARDTGPSSEAETPSCGACGGQALSALYPAMEAGFELLSCTACGALRTWPDVPDVEIGRWYPQAYYGEGNVRFNPLMERMTHLFAIARAKRIARDARPGRVLDVGCGRGVMLAAFRELGFEARGVELSDEAAAHARERLGLEVFTGSLEKAPLDDGSFDLVVFWHSLEHFRAPQKALAVAHRLLRAGGRLAVAVPNAESLQARLFKSRWFHLDVPRHYHHFGTRSLRRLLERTSFSVDEVSHLNLEQNPYGALQSLLNAVGFPESFLYSLLKDPSARTHDVKNSPGLVAATLALLPLVTPLSCGLALAEATLKRGGTIEMYARKR